MRRIDGRERFFLDDAGHFVAFRPPL